MSTALGLVASGSGDSKSFNYLLKVRRILKKDDSFTCRYGHMQMIHKAIGFLFCGNCNYYVSSENNSMIKGIKDQNMKLNENDTVSFQAPSEIIEVWIL